MFKWNLHNCYWIVLTCISIKKTEDDISLLWRPEHAFHISEPLILVFPFFLRGGGSNNLVCIWLICKIWGWLLYIDLFHRPVYGHVSTMSTFDENWNDLYTSKIYNYMFQMNIVEYWNGTIIFLIQN